ncbi:hypothetical protein ACJROX_14450 [Pseudalkalibacillus sp. A8]|uniref:hypothetical protein n=1 Tax=Pseudalkalibacillus sp. A8 TaxID=3382641 RepID=UPI0038B5FB89
MHLVAEAEIHLPDLAFVKLCEEKYGINRGIYNTIDAWFYEKGVTHIVHRRSIMMTFFRSLPIEFYERNRSGKVLFGHGGLTNQLEEFWQYHTNDNRR